MIENSCSATAIIPVEENASSVCKKMAVKDFTIDEKVVAFFQSMVDNFNNGVEVVKKLASMKSVIFMKGLSVVVMTPFTLVSVVKTCRVFVQHSREKKIDAILALCEQVRRIGENMATLVVSLEGMKFIRQSPIAWAKPFAAALSILSVASIVSNVRTCVKIKRLMQEWDKIEKAHQEKGQMTLAGYRAIQDLIKRKQKEDSDFVSETFNISEDQLESALCSVEQTVESGLASDQAEKVDEAMKLVEKTAATLKGRVKHNLVSAKFVTVSSVINLIGTTLLLTCPVLPVGWIVLGVTVLIDGSNWVRHKVVDYQFAKTLHVKRTKWEWVIC